MKIIKINDNLKVNIEQIYSLEKSSNKKDIEEWESSYKKHLDAFTEDPPLLAIDEYNLFRPQFGESYDGDELKKYSDALRNHIIQMIGQPPTLKESYRIILSTGLKINIDKSIYDKIDEYISKYIDE